MGCFHDPRPFWDGVRSLSWISSAPMMLSNSCLWVCEMSILPWSYKLAMCWYSLIFQRNNSHSKSDPSSAENTSEMPFKQRKLQVAHQCSERKKQDIVVFAMIGELDVGKRQAWLSWAKRHWGWCPYTEVNVWSSLVAWNLLFSRVISKAILPCLYKLALWWFSSLVQPRHCNAHSAISWRVFQAMKIT